MCVLFLSQGTGKVFQQQGGWPGPWWPVSGSLWEPGQDTVMETEREKASDPDVIMWEEVDLKTLSGQSQLGGCGLTGEGVSRWELTGSQVVSLVLITSSLRWLRRVEQNVGQGKGSCLVTGGPGSISEGWGRLGEGSYRFPCGSVSVDYLFWESEHERKESLDAALFFFFFFFEPKVRR